MAQFSFQFPDSSHRKYLKMFPAEGDRTEESKIWREHRISQCVSGNSSSSEKPVYVSSHYRSRLSAREVTFTKSNKRRTRYSPARDASHKFPPHSYPLVISAIRWRIKFSAVFKMSVITSRPLIPHSPAAKIGEEAQLTMHGSLVRFNCENSAVTLSKKAEENFKRDGKHFVPGSAAAKEDRRRLGNSTANAILTS